MACRTPADVASVWRTIAAIRAKESGLSKNSVHWRLGILEAPRLRAADLMLREEMEILIIFALIASYKAHRQLEPAVTEPEEFQPFDLQALRNSAENRPSRSSSRQEAYEPQTLREWIEL
jgi:hypothetical protein